MHEGYASGWKVCQVFWKNILKLFSKKFWKNKKAYYLCRPVRGKAFRQEIERGGESRKEIGKHDGQHLELGC